MAASFEGLLLDVGAVLVRTPFEMHAVAESRYGFAPGSLTWMGPHDPSTDPLWRQMRAGDVSELDYWRRRAEETERRAGRTGGLQEYMAMCFGGPQEEFVRPEAEVVPQVVPMPDRGADPALKSKAHAEE